MQPAIQKNPHRLSVKATLLVASMLTTMTGAAISPSLVSMEAAFDDVDHAAFWVRLVLTLPALFIVFGAPLAGWIIDRYQRKPLLIASVLLFGFAGGSGLIAPTLTAILVGRALLGLAAAGIRTSVTTLITDYFTGPHRGRFLGFQAGFMGLGGTTFLTVGGQLADVGWRYPFVVYLLAFVALPVIVILLYEPDREPPPLKETDPAEAAIAITKAPVRLMLFIYSTLVFAQIIFYLVPVEFSFYLKDLVGAESAEAGFAIATLTLSFAIGSLSYGRIRRRLTRTQAITVGFMLIGMGYLSIGLASGWVLIRLGLPLAGFGLGMVVPNLNVWLADSVPDALRGRALGLFTMSIFLGQFLSPVVTQPITAAWSARTTFTLAGVAALAAAVAVGVLLSRRSATHPARS